MSRLSASKIDLAKRCQFWLSPHAPSAPKQEQTTYSRRGNEAHAVAEQASRDPSSETVAASPWAASVALADETVPDGARFEEVAYAWDCGSNTARELTTNGHRDYSMARKNEIVGTADLVVVCEDRVFVRDLKTGRGARDTEAIDSMQLQFLALCAARVHGKSSATIELYHLDEDPERCYGDREDLTAIDLYDIETELADLWSAIDGAQAVPIPGTHCYSSWCPIRQVCPATMATLARIDEAAHRGLPMAPTIDNDDQAARVVVGMKVVESAFEYNLKAWKEQLRAYVDRNGPIDMGEGEKYGAVEVSKDSIRITHDHIATIERVMGAGNARLAVGVSTSKAAIERACKSLQARRGEGSAMAREVVESLRRENAVRTSRYVNYTTFRAGESSEDES